MFNWLTRLFKKGSVVLPGLTVNAEDASRELRKEGFRCYDYLVSGVEVAGIDRKQNGRLYEVYKSHNRAVALRFLNNIPNGVIPESHYVIVETPQGNVGKDKLGVFDE